VKASNSCGTSANTCKTITLIQTAPTTPGTISGPSNLCPLATGTFSITSVANATNYIWTVSANLSITSGQGTTSIVVSALSGFTTSGTVNVVASNCVGNSSIRSKTITGGGTALPAPVFTAGPTTNLCNKVNQIYTISSITGATSYNWIVPANTQIVTNSGTSITVNFLSGFVSGNISVSGNNSCGAGPTALRAVSAAPTQPGTITGSATVCKSNLRTYSIAAVSGATSYTWSASNGASITSGQGTTSVNVLFSGVASPAVVISVQSNNSCTSSIARTKNVTVNMNCRSVNDEIRMTTPTLEFLTVFPNPSAGKSIITFNSNVTSKYILKVVDLTGNIIVDETNPVIAGKNEKEINLEYVANGLYLVVLHVEGGEPRTIRMVVE
jgi:hypothetical protein